MDIIRVVITSFTSVLVLFLFAKLIGNKQMSQLNMFDYINGITIGSIAAEFALSEFSEMIYPLIAMGVYTFVALLFAVVSNKSQYLRRFLNGKSSLLFDNGRLYKKNLGRAKLDVDEFLAQLRVAGYFDLADVQTAFIESNGRISILPKTSKNFCTPQQMSLNVVDKKAQVNVIVDSKILSRNLKFSGKDEKWLKSELSKMKKQLDDIFLATCDENGVLTVYDKIYSKPTNDIFQ